MTHDTATTLPAAPVALTIAGSDSGGGAGIQADLKTFFAFGVHGASAITAITAQNTCTVRAIHPLPPGMVTAQLDAVFDDLAIRAVKIGMLGDAGIVRAVAERLAHHRPSFVLLDPVMIASSGARLLPAEALAALLSRLLPLVDCLTPNLAEAAALLGTAPATSEAAMHEQGRALLGLGARAVLVKGGHAPLAEAVDLLVTPAGTRRFAAPWIDSRNLHGTGCTLAAAIAAGVALGQPLPVAVERAKRYLGAAIAAGARRRIGHGRGPLAHDQAVAGDDEDTTPRHTPPPMP